MKRLVLAIATALVLSAPGVASADMAHWPATSNQPVDRTVYYRVSVTGSSWGQDTAAAQWSGSAYATYSYAGGAPCAETSWVNICTQTLGNTGQGGSTYLTYELGTKHMVSAYTRLNRTYGDVASLTWRQTVACHELGHDLGLYVAGAERQTTGSCTYRSLCSPPCTPTYTAPDSTDFTNIELNSAHYDNLPPIHQTRGSRSSSLRSPELVHVRVDTMIGAVPSADGSGPILYDKVTYLKR